ncbi:hypothetical protein GCM10012275_05990 [Longimycelium tulufanense]|uniref:Antitoxin n=1 Tax=Longimycelium tulufanense TaxID=907463 RepID=A0A8J3FSG0_9PSEU|nr:hypothetical protein GCM10012275_05990 [Longimycelium tulufanense]
MQIGEIPEDVHRNLMARAAAAGQSLSEFLRHELARIATRSAPEELLRRVRARKPGLGKTLAEIIREVRDTR